MSAFSPALRSVAVSMLAVLAFVLAPLVALAQVAVGAHHRGLAPIPRCRRGSRPHRYACARRAPGARGQAGRMGAADGQSARRAARALDAARADRGVLDSRCRSVEDRAQGPGQRRAAAGREERRKLRIEVGYGFEGVLTDATSKRIIARRSPRCSGRTSSRPASTRRRPHHRGHRKGEALPPVAQGKPGPQSIDVPFAW